MGTPVATVPGAPEVRPRPRFRKVLVGGLLRLVQGIGIYGVPAYFLHKFLLSLTGTALWLPPGWRKTVLVFGIALGLACYHIASSRMVAAKSPETRGAQGGLGQRVRFTFRKYMTAQWMALYWFGLAALLLVPHTFLRLHTVKTWQPDEAVAAYFLGEDSAEPVAAEPAAAEPDDEVAHGPFFNHVRLERRGDTTSGTVLVPPRFLLTDRTEELLRRRETIDDRHPIRYLLDEEPVLLIETLEDHEATAISLTVLAFLFLNLAILCVASVAYGYSFSVFEDLGVQAVRLI